MKYRDSKKLHGVMFSHVKPRDIPLRIAASVARLLSALPANQEVYSVSLGDPLTHLFRLFSNT